MERRRLHPRGHDAGQRALGGAAGAAAARPPAELATLGSRWTAMGFFWRRTSDGERVLYLFTSVAGSAPDARDPPGRLHRSKVVLRREPPWRVPRRDDLLRPAGHPRGWVPAHVGAAGVEDRGPLRRHQVRAASAPAARGKAGEQGAPDLLVSSIEGAESSMQADTPPSPPRAGGAAPGSRHREEEEEAGSATPSRQSRRRARRSRPQMTHLVDLASRC